MKRWVLLGLFVLSVAVVGCSTATNAPAKTEGASVTGATLERTAAGDDMFFTVPVEKAGDLIGIDFRGTVMQGSLRAQLVDQNGKVTWSQTASAGSFAYNVTLNAPQAGSYKLGLAWDGAVQAQYSLIWKPHAVEVAAVSPLALMGSLGMILVGLGFCIYALYKRLGWKYLLLGMPFWFVTVALKFAWAIGANGAIYSQVNGALGGLALGAFSLYVGALTGVFEVALTYLVLRYTRLGRATWSMALAFGIGFGAIEAILLGSNSLIAVIAALVTPNLLPLDALTAIAALNNPLFALAPVWERFFTIWVHILSNVLIFYAIARRKPQWFWLAFVYKTLIDAVAGYAQVSGMIAGTGDMTLLNMWIIEAVVALFGIIGWVGTRWVGARYPGQHVAA
ncbi:MAG: YhfC family glutamic-type intramembrane protease [Anaerolineae bacterium]